MGLETTIADDFLMIDGLEPVTLRARTSESAFTNYENVRAYRETVDKLVEQPDGSVLRQTVTVWHLPQKPLTKASVPVTSPKIGDRIQQADDTQWHVETADKDHLGLEWVCQARKVPGATG